MDSTSWMRPICRAERCTPSCAASTKKGWRREQRPPRRYYELTAAGESRLAEARARFRALDALAAHMAKRWKPA